MPTPPTHAEAPFWGYNAWVLAPGQQAPTAAFQDQVGSGLRVLLKSLHLSHSIPGSQSLPSGFQEPPPLEFSQHIWLKAQVSLCHSPPR